jgi:hypothetical protein
MQFDINDLPEDITLSKFLSYTSRHPEWFTELDTKEDVEKLILNIREWLKHHA